MAWVAHFQSVLSGLQKSLDQQKKLAPPRKARPQWRHPEANPRFHVSGDLEGRIAGLLNQNSDRMAGRVYLFDLAPIIDQLKCRGMYLENKCFHVAEQVLERNMLEADFYARYQDRGFLAVFATLYPDAAQLKSATIAKTIAERLLGGSVPAGIGQARLVSSANGQTFQFTDVPTVEQIGDLLARGKTAFVTANHEEPPVEPPCEWAYDMPGTEFTDQVLKRMSFQFMPLLSVNVGRIANYVWRLSRTDEGGRVHYGHDCVLESGASKEIRELDMFSLSRFRARVMDNAEPISCLITFPVHFETLAAMKGRQTFVSVCSSLPHTLRHNLVFEMVGLPDGIVASRFLELLGVVRPFCRSMLIRVAPNFGPLPDLRYPNLFGLGVDLGEYVGEEGGGHLRTFPAKTHQLGLKAYLIGLSSPRMVGGALR